MLEPKNNRRKEVTKVKMVTLDEGDGVTLNEGDWGTRAALTGMPLILLLNLFLPLMLEMLVLGKHLCWVFLAIFWEISVMLVEE